MYSRLMRYYEDHILPSPDRDLYIKGLRSLRFMMSGTSALPAPLREKWTDLSGGQRIIERYGSSELSTVILTPMHNNLAVPDVSQSMPSSDISHQKVFWLTLDRGRLGKPWLVAT